MNEHTLLQTLQHIPQDICCAQDYEALASRFIPADRLAYLSGGSGRDITLERNRQAFESYAITPRVLRNMNSGSLSTQLGNIALQHPFMLAPVAHQKLVHPEGEQLTAYAAQSMDTAFVASTLSSFSLEEIAQQHNGPRWFQFYKQSSDEASEQLLQRALNAGYQALVLTLDTSLQAPSHRSLRSGFQWPEELVAKNLIGLPETKQNAPVSIFEQAAANSLDAESIQRLIKRCPIPVFAKGVLCAEEAKVLKEMGCAGIIVSNHGGRALDGAPSSLSVLPEIRTALGDDYPILLDSGIRSGADIFKAIALGADAVMIGRLQIYALSVAGALGVAHMIKCLREELEYTMAMTGCSSIQDIRQTTLTKAA